MTEADRVAEIDRRLRAVLSGTAAGALRGSVHLHCTDIDGEWMIERDPQGAVVLERRHAKGDCAIRGTAAGLLSLVSGTGTLSGLEVSGEIEVFGEIEVAESFAAMLKLG